MKFACFFLALVPLAQGTSLHQSLVQSLEDALTDEMGRRRGRGRGRGGGEDPVCQEIKQNSIVLDFSACNSDDSGSGVSLTNQNNGSCDVHNNRRLSYNERRKNCQEDQGCQWYGPPTRPPNSHFCQANPCFRINNNRCTIQDTGGRCVWWTKEDNKKFFGRDYPGCYESPCQHPVPNRPNGCTNHNKLVPFKYWGERNEKRFAEDSPYQCVWCSGGWGCQNAKMTSKAQCANIGDIKGCSSCMGKLGEDCPGTCAEHCCDSPYCRCAKSVSTRTTTALNILTAGQN